jgi:serine/threonine protein kinase
LDHANIVRLVGVGRIRRAYGLLMEYCNGGSLVDRMAAHGGRLPAYEGAMLMRQCLAGLVHAHAQDVVHRDVNPKNVLLQHDKDRLVAKLADIGVASVFELPGLLGMTASCQAAIDYQFMPPERLSDFRQSDPRSDLWGLGATFYHAMTGQLPRDFRGRHPIEVVLHEEIPPAHTREPSIPEPVARVIDRSLRRQVSQRYQTALEMQEALERAVRSGGLGLR